MVSSLETSKKPTQMARYPKQFSSAKKILDQNVDKVVQNPGVVSFKVQYSFSKSTMV
jgi:hypothetical protein